MALRNRFLLTLSIAAACTCAPIELRAQTHDERSYVMLINGNVFHGVAKPVGDRIEIQISDGNVIHISSQQVASVASTKLELYERQIKGSKRIGANEHWYITQWCIQEGLLDQAIAHFEALTPLVDHNDKYKQLEHKLKTAIFNSEKVRNMLGEKHPHHNAEATAIAQASSNSDKSKAAPVAVVQASANVPATPLTDAQAQLLNSMPSYVKKSFQSHISPLLVSRCGQAGCHGVPGANTEFHFRQAVGDQAGSVVARNLENVVRYINPDSPAASELISYATKAHGTQTEARFQPHARDDDRRHIERLTQWIKSLALASPSGVSQVAVSIPTIPQNQVVNAVAMQNMGTVADLPIAAIATSSNNSPSSLGSIGTTRATSSNADALSLADEGNGRMAKIQEWRDLDMQQDRDAKLSKSPPKSGDGAPVLSFEELSELEAAIDRLEKKHSRQKTRDPFDPNYFNSTYGAKK